MDAIKNLAYSTVLTPPSPAASGTSLVVQVGHGARYPTPPFNATVSPIGEMPTPLNTEIVRVTGIAADTLTILREQEDTTARTILVGDQIYESITKKTFDDLAAELASGDVLRRVTRTFTQAEIQSLGTVPIQIIAAPGVDAVLYPISAVCWFTRGSVGFSADPSWIVTWVGDPSRTLIGIGGFFLTSPGTVAHNFKSINKSEFSIGYGGFDPRNAGLQIKTSGDVTGGSNDWSIRISVLYAVIQF